MKKVSNFGKTNSGTTKVHSWRTLAYAKVIHGTPRSLEISLMTLWYTSAVLFNLFQVAEPLKHFWRNLDTKNSANLRILAEPCKELAEHVGSAEPRLKKTALVPLIKMKNN